MNELNQARFGLHEAKGKLAYALDVFGDYLAKREGYIGGLNGIDAVHFYLMQKHHWLPRDVKSMSEDDLQLAMNQELAGWRMPAEAI